MLVIYILYLSNRKEQVLKNTRVELVKHEGEGGRGGGGVIFISNYNYMM